MNGEGIQIYGGRSKDRDRRITMAMKQAARIAPKMQHDAERIAKKFGGFTTPQNLKTRSSVEGKLKRDDADISTIKDLARTTIIVPADKIEDVLKELGGIKGFMRTKRQGGADFLGYSGNIVNIMYNGVPTEIQVNTPEMIYAKEKFKDAYRILGKERMHEIHKKTLQPAGMGHAYYENYRGDKNEKGQAKHKLRRGGTHTAKLDSINYYDSFRS